MQPYAAPSSMQLRPIIMRMAPLLGYGLIFGVWLTFSQPSSMEQGVLSTAVQLPLLAIIAWSSWRASSAVRDTRTRRAWRLIAAGNVASLIGGTFLLWCVLVLGVVASPSVADVAYVAVYVLLLCGLLTFPAPPLSRAALLASWLDISVVFVGAAMILWQVLLEPIARATDTDPLTTLFSLLYPTLDLVLLFGAARLWLIRPSGHRGFIFGCLAVSAALFAVFDCVSAYLFLQGQYQDTIHWIVFALVSLMLVALAAQVELASPSSEVTRVAPVASERPGFTVLPYTAVAAVYGLLALHVLNDPHGEATDLIAGAAAITALVMARQFTTLRDNQHLYERAEDARTVAEKAMKHVLLVLENMNDAYFSVDAAGRITYANRRAQEMFRSVKADPNGRCDEARLPEAIEATLHEAGPLLGRNGQSIERDIRFGESRWLALRAFGAEEEVSIFLTDITARKEQQERDRVLSLHDPLTGLWNRRAFDDIMNRTVARARRGPPGALLMLDLDRFKQINDQGGHQAGDEALRRIARLMGEQLRPNDTLARLGGDEFAVVLAETPLDSALTIAERLLVSVRAFRLPWGAQTFDLGLSAGVAPVSGDLAAETVIARADAALYRAKAVGRNRALLACPEDAMPATEYSRDLSSLVT